MATAVSMFSHWVLGGHKMGRLGLPVGYGVV